MQHHATPIQLSEAKPPRVTCSVSWETYQALNRIAALQGGRSISSLVREAVEAAVDGRDFSGQKALGGPEA